MPDAIYPVAAGQPSMSGSYIPNLFAAELLVEFYAQTFIDQIANTDYEGTIAKQGDKVTIPGLPDFTIRDHVIGAPVNYETPTPKSVDLLIDKGKEWGFEVPTVNKAQSLIDFAQEWAASCAKQMKVEISKTVLESIYGDVDAHNTGATAGVTSASFDLGAAGAPEAVTKANIIDYIVDCANVLDEQNVPDDGRWMLLPNWACGMIKKSDLADAAMTGETNSILLGKKGGYGVYDRFQIFATNQLKTAIDGTTPVTHALFGHKSALTFATQITENDMMKNPFKFGDLWRGLQVFGFKVVKPEAIGHLYINKGTISS